MLAMAAYSSSIGYQVRAVSLECHLHHVRAIIVVHLQAHPAARAALTNSRRVDTPVLSTCMI